MGEPVSNTSSEPLTDVSWLALAALTETNRAAEWPWVMQVMINRTRKHGAPIVRTVREPFQFSAFNATRHVTDDSVVFETIRKELGQGEAALDSVARICAQAMLALPMGCGVLPLQVLDYWSPRSMVPPGVLPGWDWRSLFCFTAPFIPRDRFVFALTVPVGDPRAGNQANFGVTA